MSNRRHTFTRALAAATIALALAVAPASATVPDGTAPAAVCVLDPGVYGITDSSGRLIGILIVYPDCRMEVVKRPEIT